MSNNTVKPSVPQIIINYKETDRDKGAYVSFPRFWIDEYFNSICEWQGRQTKDGKNRKGQRVPASFWKYTLYLWRHVSMPRHGSFITEIPADQFPVRSDVATQWTAAYAVSGVMEVEIGRWTKQHDQPTVFTYKPETTHAEWRCFLSALDYAYNTWQNHKQGGEGKTGANVGAWKVLVARIVDEFRTRAGLLPTNEQFLGDAASGRILDQWDRPIAELDGAQIVQPIFYQAVPRNKLKCKSIATGSNR
jgi:hypothetical protein